MAKVFIIAEAGVNHNGSLDLAIKLVEEAHKAGADAVKFQTFNPKAIITSDAPKAEYQKKQTGEGSQLGMLEKLSLSHEEHRTLKEKCEELGIEFMSSPFDLDSATFLKELGVNRFKIGSGELTNFPLLKHIASMNMPTILSTGMATIEEIQTACEVFNKEDLILLHCNTEYPTPLEHVNLKAMLHINKETGVEYGYSDHTLGFTACLSAVALGATVLEKHFTLDKTMDGPDHSCSLEPHELKQMVGQVREAELCLSGDGIKRPTDSEIKNVNIVRKSIVAATKIQKGQIITENDVTTKRPGDGLSPFKWEAVIGSKAVRDFDVDERIEL